MRRLGWVVAAIVVGCGSGWVVVDRFLQSPVAPVAPVSIVKAAVVDPELSAFKAHVTRFIMEARALGRLMEGAPDLADVKRKRDVVQDAYLRIPDPPSKQKWLGKVSEEGKQIMLTVDITVAHLRVALDGARSFGPEMLNSGFEASRKAAVEVKGRLDRMEVALREPK